MSCAETCRSLSFLSQACSCRRKRFPRKT
ncbi:MAG: hypothetical protein EG828_09590 [Deltaproteobacteria bacterium]|nr:hypothetical protein [Deltaproteobacteria bacterium]